MSSETNKKQVSVGFSYEDVMTSISQILDRRTTHLVLGFLIGAITSSLFLLSPSVRKESAFMLAVFNVLFVPLIFPLAGKISGKVLILLMGNALGYIWNALLSLIVVTAVDSFGELANTFYMILSPVLNLIWIVPYWSISLTVLSKSRGPEDQ